MNLAEAKEWLTGTLSMTNIVPQHPFGTWQGRIAAADAEMVKQAYWIVRAHHEGLIHAGRSEALPIETPNQGGK